MDLHIKISGMGSTITKEVYLITEFLKEKGYTVVLDDEHPPQSIENLDLENLNTNKKINIVTNHLPWGG